MEKRYTLGLLDPEKEICICDHENHEIIARGSVKERLVELVVLANKGNQLDKR